MHRRSADATPPGVPAATGCDRTTGEPGTVRRSLRPGWPVAWLLIALLRGYRRWISPLLPPACRFEPSCSVYAMGALRTHALPSALGLVTWRLLRCQPLCKGGHDPVPPGRFGCEAPDSATPASGDASPAASLNVRGLPAKETTR